MIFNTIDRYLVYVQTIALEGVEHIGLVLVFAVKHLYEQGGHCWLYLFRIEHVFFTKTRLIGEDIFSEHEYDKNGYLGRFFNFNLRGL